MSDIGNVETWFTARGLTRYSIAVSHQELHKFQVVRGDDISLVGRRAQALAAQWDEIWRKRRLAADIQARRLAAAQDVEQKKRIAADRTDEAKAALDQVRGILDHTLSVDDSLDWESLKDKTEYPVEKPIRPALRRRPVPTDPLPEPQSTDPAFQPQPTLLDRLLPGLADALIPARRSKRLAAAEVAFRVAHRRWEGMTRKQHDEYKSRLREYDEQVRSEEAEYRAALAPWEEGQARHKQNQEEANDAVELRRAQYLNREPHAITEYCEIILTNSAYPDSFPQETRAEYNSEARLLLVEYQLPPPDALPKIVEVRYVRSSDQFVEKVLPTTHFTKLYDNVLYQIALRTLHELFEADGIGALASIVFNGYVRSVDPATGHEVNPCIISVQATKEEFAILNLRDVEPKACFRRLKGVSSARLHSLTPIPPLVTFSRDDRRFIEARAVADSIGEGDNLASMPWEDFEHLVRELFEREFSSVGGEVRVTRSSRDAGVDAIVFDPDPLRGGKIVIQAKRYTNTVGVSAVRDLYGTLLNEGANKGILVTTSDYGPDAYEFARGKPIVLMNGGNLLHLLAQHGKKARIDLQEAKRLQSE